MGIGLAPSARPAAREALGLPALRGHLAVGADAPERDRRGGLQHAAAERARERPVEGQVEVAPAALEVLVELAAHVVQARGRLEHARREPGREPVEHGVGAAGVVLVGERGQSARRGGGHQRADGRVDQRVVDVGRGGRGEARGRGRGIGRVEGGRGEAVLGHAVISCRNLRSPSKALRRAASSEHAQRRRDLAVAEVAGEAQQHGGALLGRAAHGRGPTRRRRAARASAAPPRRAGRRRPAPRGACARGSGRAPCGARWSAPTPAGCRGASSDRRASRTGTSPGSSRRPRRGPRRRPGSATPPRDARRESAGTAVGTRSLNASAVASVSTRRRGPRSPGQPAQQRRRAVALLAQLDAQPVEDRDARARRRSPRTRRTARADG